MMATMSGTKLMALCTIAVGALYAAGYVYTEPAAQASGISASTGAAVHLASAVKTGGVPSASPSTTAPSTTAPSSQSSSAYRDGTYTGSGSNSYGTLSVSVQIQGGKIRSVQITSYAMHYPSSYIFPQMADQVVSKQTWQVDVVSGATASSDNFALAVYNALQQARTGGTSTSTGATTPTPAGNGGSSVAPPSSPSNGSGQLVNPFNPNSIPSRHGHHDHYHRDDNGYYGGRDD